MINPFIAAVMGTILHLKRKCPKCKRERVTKPSEKNIAVKCKHCGTKIPPLKS